MKVKLSILLLSVAVLSTWAADLAVNWQQALRQTPAGAAVVNGWRLNNYRKNPKRLRKNAGSKEFSYTAAFMGPTYSIVMSKARADRQVYCIITDAYGNSVQTETVTLSMK